MLCFVSLPLLYIWVPMHVFQCGQKLLGWGGAGWGGVGAGWGGGSRGVPGGPGGSQGFQAEPSPLGDGEAVKLS